MTESREQFDLAIVGAGPTGLSAALLARSLGLSVVILDKAAGPLEVGRADALNCRTQEYFEIMGIIDGAIPLGLKCNTSSTFENGEFTSRQSHWWTSLRHTQQPNFLMLGQPDVQRLLRDHLDVPVRYGIHVQDFKETSSSVQILTGDGTIESKYLIGADGARSFVRHALDIPFTGTKPNMIWVVLDAFLDTDFPTCPEIITFQKDGQSRISWIPRERGMARFYVLLDHDRSQEAAEAEIRKFIAPYRIDFKHTEWFSTFEIKERLAGTYFSPQKRLILAGDACHVHAVNGGQGMNTGIADSFALVWRLALATRGYPAALQSYETERREVAQGVLDISNKLVRTTIKTAIEYVSIIEKNAAYITGAGVTYTSGTPLIHGSPQGDFVPGHRCPDLTLHTSPVNGQSEPRRIYSMLRYGRFTILCFDTIELPSKEFSWAYDVWNISTDGKAVALEQLERANANELEARSFKGDFSLETKAVVIRPDAYVGYCGDDVLEYFCNIFT